MSTTLSDIAKILKNKDTKGDSSHWGVVHSVIEDGEGNVIGYNVSLDGSANGTVRCNKLVGAEVGDQVNVVLKSNGEAVVTATKGGDTDALDAKENAAQAILDAEEAKEAVEEVESHFWTNDAGAHITQNESSTNGKNVLINANGMIIADGDPATSSNQLAAFGASMIELGKNAVSSIVKLCGGKGVIKYGANSSGSSNGLFVKNSTVTSNQYHGISILDNGTIMIDGRDNVGYFGPYIGMDTYYDEGFPNSVISFGCTTLYIGPQGLENVQMTINGDVNIVGSLKVNGRVI